jgi:DNA-binding PadR family transcriptional regulator
LRYVSKCDISDLDMEVKHSRKDKGQETDGDRPLSSAALHILLALAESDLHGYGIMQSVKRQSGGTFRLGPGTLYANLDRLLASGLVGETERKLKNGETRREYSLTLNGERVLRLEILRLRQVVNVARARLGKLDESGA